MPCRDDHCSLGPNGPSHHMVVAFVQLGTREACTHNRLAIPASKSSQKSMGGVLARTSGATAVAELNLAMLSR